MGWLVGGLVGNLIGCSDGDMDIMLTGSKVGELVTLAGLIVGFKATFGEVVGHTDVGKTDGSGDGWIDVGDAVTTEGMEVEDSVGIDVMSPTGTDVVDVMDGKEVGYLVGCVEGCDVGSAKGEPLGNTVGNETG